MTVKQHTWIISASVGWASGQGLAGSSTQGLSQGSSYGVRAELSSEGSAGQGSKCLWLLAKFSSWRAAGLRPSVPSLLLALSHPQFFATWAPPTGPLASLMRANQEGSRESLPARWKVQSYVT